MILKGWPNRIERVKCLIIILIDRLLPPLFLIHKKVFSQDFYHFTEKGQNFLFLGQGCIIIIDLTWSGYEPSGDGGFAAFLRVHWSFQYVHHNSKVNWYWFDLALYTDWPVILLARKFKNSIQLQVGRLLGWVEYMSCASLV